MHVSHVGWVFLCIISRHGSANHSDSERAILRCIRSTTASLRPRPRAPTSNITISVVARFTGRLSAPADQVAHSVVATDWRRNQPASSIQGISTAVRHVPFGMVASADAPQACDKRICFAAGRRGQGYHTGLRHHPIAAFYRTSFGA